MVDCGMTEASARTEIEKRKRLNVQAVKKFVAAPNKSRAPKSKQNSINRQSPVKSPDIKTL